jgi:hypothetical protein
MRFIHPVLTLQPVETQLVVALSLGSKTCELKTGELKAGELKTSKLKARELKASKLKAGELKTGAGWKLNWRQF